MISFKRFKFEEQLLIESPKYSSRSYGIDDKITIKSGRKSRKNMISIKSYDQMIQDKVNNNIEKGKNRNEKKKNIKNLKNVKKEEKKI